MTDHRSPAPHPTTGRPVSTYRVQVRHAFDLHSVAELTDYLAELGVGLGLPVAAARGGAGLGPRLRRDRPRPGRPARGVGGRAASRRRRAAHAAGLGVLVDIVPEPRRRRDAAARTPGGGTCSRTAASRGTPTRSTSTGTSATAGSASRCSATTPSDLDAADDRGRRARATTTTASRSRRAPRTTAPMRRPCTRRQHYELVDWRRADADLNYRRFFAVNTLAGLRVEVPEVFDASHAEILGWVRERPRRRAADRPSGRPRRPGRLPRPPRRATGGRLRRSSRRSSRATSRCPRWATAGTTGYDALGDFDRVFVDPAGERPLDALAARLADEPVDWHDLIHDDQARGRRRHPALRGAAPRARGRPSRRTRTPTPRRRGRRAARLLPGLPHLPALRRRAPRRRRSREATRRRPDLAAEIAAVAGCCSDADPPSRRGSSRPPAW